MYEFGFNGWRPVDTDSRPPNPRETPTARIRNGVLGGGRQGIRHRFHSMHGARRRRKPRTPVLVSAILGADRVYSRLPLA